MEVLVLLSTNSKTGSRGKNVTTQVVNRNENRGWRNLKRQLIARPNKI